jgi:hypothetical protein
LRYLESIDRSKLVAEELLNELDDEDVVKKKKKKKSKKNKKVDNKMEVEPQDLVSSMCPICLEPMIERCITKCGHIFCKACLETHMKNPVKYNEYYTSSPTCPTCRSFIQG